MMTVRLLLCCMGTSVFSAKVFAAAVEGPDVRSSLNQALRVRLAITLREGEDLAPNCVRAVAPKRDDLPVALDARAILLRDERGPYVLYRSASTITEPVIRGAVEVGCTDPVTREFVVLLDPPAINAPQVQAGSPNQPVAPAPRAPSVASVPIEGSAEVSAPKTAYVQTRVRTRAAQQVVSAATPTPPKRLKPKRTEVASPKLTDRLTLSAPDAAGSGLLGASGNGGAGLRLSDLLTQLPQPDAAPADANQARRLAIEQARLAAILRDEDPIAAAAAKEHELTERLLTTDRDLAAARAQVKDLTARNRDLESFAWLRWVAWGLAGLLLLAAAFFGIRAIIDALQRRGRKQESQEGPWWTGVPSTRLRNPVTTTVDDLYLDTIKPVGARSKPAQPLDTPTTTFEAAAVDSAHKIDVQELDHGSTTFMREFEPAPQTQPDSFSTTIVQPTEFQRSAQPTRFEATKVQPVKPAGTPRRPKPAPFPDTLPPPSLSTMPPLDFDLKLPPLDLDVTAPEGVKANTAADTQKTVQIKPAVKPPAKP